MATRKRKTAAQRRYDEWLATLSEKELEAELYSVLNMLRLQWMADLDPTAYKDLAHAEAIRSQLDSRVRAIDRKIEAATSALKTLNNQKKRSSPTTT